MYSVQVRILGREYTLRSQEPPEQIQRVAAFVEEKLAETAAVRSTDTRDLTVLTLLNLAGQHLQLLEEQRQSRQELGKRLEQLVCQLEQSNSGC
ncbi:MAG: cell division protein ZapA [Desulfuromonadales bacterium]|nr:cell division protein ZapA [Chloroflexota bacterium]MCK4623228.1 cell division protein ZapA [Desulfuromonadales bacterium]